MSDYNLGNANLDARTVEFLKRDFSVLLQGLEGRNLSEINLDAIIEYLDILKHEVENVKMGINSRDNFVSYTMSPDDITSVFDKNATSRKM